MSGSSSVDVYSGGKPWMPDEARRKGFCWRFGDLGMLGPKFGFRLVTRKACPLNEMVPMSSYDEFQMDRIIEDMRVCTPEPNTDFFLSEITESTPARSCVSPRPDRADHHAFLRVEAKTKMLFVDHDESQEKNMDRIVFRKHRGERVAFLRVDIVDQLLSMQHDAQERTIDVERVI